MHALPKRKPIRVENYDYSTQGAYFITVCTANREKIFWSDRRGELCSPADNTNTGDQRSPLRVELSNLGNIVDAEIQKLNTLYDAVRVDKYCIMPDHIHFILSVDTDENGRTQFAPTISRVMKQFKGSITKQVGRPIWQKSFYDHGIQNQQDYDEIWAYIENNPLKYNMH
ncbi:MAG: transposase [Clostridia bacterium]|nr:transposase [Clostridia bacterium]